MSEPTHTPGPWEVIQHGQKIVVRTESPSKTRFGASRYAAVGGFERSDPKQLAEALANARLIAAAPELLEALQAITDAAKEKRVTAEHYEVASAAINKATGKQS